MPVSPAGRDRARRLDRALDEARAANGNDRNRDAASPVKPSHGDKSLRLPNTNNRRVAGR